MSCKFLEIGIKSERITSNQVDLIILSHFSYIFSSETKDDKKIDILGLMLGNSGNESRSRNNTFQRTSTSPAPQESLNLGPLEISNIGNSSLKRIRLSRWFEKSLRDEIYRRNLATRISGSRESSLTSVRKRNIRSTAADRGTKALISKRQGRQGLGLAVGGGGQGVTSPQYFLLMQQQQQEQAMAAALLQQQMLSLQNQRYNQNQSPHRQRPYHRYQDDNYYDDSESDEDDDFDSEEFMSFPIRMGFMPPIPGFPGKK